MPERRLAYILGGSRTVVVLGLMLTVVLVGGAIGARMLLADPDDSSSGPRVRCWDGKELARDDCSQPTGQRGLRWVFPSFRPQDGSCRDLAADDDGALATTWKCDDRIGGRPVQITYAEFDSAAAGLDLLGQQYADGIRRDVVLDGEPYRFVYRPSAESGSDGFELASAYQDHPFGVSVLAETSQDARAALENLVRFRPPDLIPGRPVR